MFSGPENGSMDHLLLNTQMRIKNICREQNVCGEEYMTNIHEIRSRKKKKKKTVKDPIFNEIINIIFCV